MSIYEALVNHIFQKGRVRRPMIAGKRVLLVSSLLLGSSGMFFERRLQQALLAQGAASCQILGQFGKAGEGPDALGDLTTLPQLVGEEPFGMIFLLEGLEKAESVLGAAQTLAAVLEPGGRLFCLARTPVLRTMVYYDDYWRFDPESLRGLFAGWTADWLLEEQSHCYLAACFVRPETVSAAPAGLLVYSCRAQAKIADVPGSFNQGYFRNFRELEAMGRRYQTDKSLYGHNYLDKYEFLLGQFRQQAFTLLELGVFHGGSEQMWREFFPKAQIVGVDIDEHCAQYAGDRIAIRILDLAKPENLEALKAVQPSIIVDDASHLWSHQLLALTQLYPCLPPGGVYILEDMETSLNPAEYPGYDDCTINPYEVCQEISRVVSSKKPFTADIPYRDEINAIGMHTDMVCLIKSSCIFIKR